MEEKEKESDNVKIEEPSDDDILIEETKQSCYSKKGPIIMIIGIILIIMALIITLYYIFQKNLNNHNYIIAKYLIKSKSLYYNIFYHTFNDSIEKIYINNTEVNISTIILNTFLF